MRYTPVRVMLGALALVVLLVNGQGPSRAGTPPFPRQLPDLVPLPPTSVEVGTRVDTTFVVHPPPDPELVLKFPTKAANVGPAPLEIGGVPTTDPMVMDAYQCVAWAASGVCLQKEKVGEIEYHQAHNHWHFREFANYELRSLVGGQPDMSAAGLLSTTEKVSFCLEDSEQVDGKTLTDSPPLYNGCTPARQGITPGWADIYGTGVPGQDVPILGIPDGDYALVITLNPAGRLRETDRSNNVTWVRVRLSGGGTNAAIID